MAKTKGSGLAQVKRRPQEDAEEKQLLEDFEARDDVEALNETARNIEGLGRFDYDFVQSAIRKYNTQIRKGKFDEIESFGNYKYAIDYQHSDYEEPSNVYVFYKDGKIISLTENDEEIPTKGVIAVLHTDGYTNNVYTAKGYEAFGYADEVYGGDVITPISVDELRKWKKAYHDYYEKDRQFGSGALPPHAPIDADKYEMYERALDNIRGGESSYAVGIIDKKTGKKIWGV